MEADRAPGLFWSYARRWKALLFVTRSSSRGLLPLVRCRLFEEESPTFKWMSCRGYPANQARTITSRMNIPGIPRRALRILSGCDLSDEDVEEGHLTSCFDAFGRDAIQTLCVCRRQLGTALRIPHVVVCHSSPLLLLLYAGRHPLFRAGGYRTQNSSSTSGILFEFLRIFFLPLLHPTRN